MRRDAKQAHRILAGFLGIFIAVHFATHFSAFGGIAQHSATLNVMRTGYQFPMIEVALVIALIAQVALGISLLRRISARKRKGLWHNIQFASGAYLAFFIVFHTTAAVGTRLGFGLDTNFYWAAGTLVLDPLKYWFVPYYVLAVTALCSHILAALHFRRDASWQLPSLAIGPVIGIAIVMAYGGGLYDVQLPDEHLKYFEDYLFAHTEPD